MNNNLMRALSRGAANAQTAAELQSLLGYETRRELSKEIHRLRKDGEIICSSTSEPMGYFLPESSEEILRFKKQMYSRIKEIRRAVSSAEKFLKESGHETTR